MNQPMNNGIAEERCKNNKFNNTSVMQINHWVSCWRAIKPIKEIHNKLRARFERNSTHLNMLIESFFQIKRDEKEHTRRQIPKAICALKWWVNETRGKYPVGKYITWSNFIYIRERVW